MPKILIHTTSLIEAKPIIDFFSLEKHLSHNNIFLNDNLLLVVSDIKKIEILNSLDYIFKNYKILKAFDLSIASCLDGSIALGTLFCTNKFISGINFANITTVEKDLESDEDLETLLVDKQASFFKEKCKENIKDYYILKIVADYFEEEKPQKEKIYTLINNSIEKWKRLI